ncbi:hypothetical protein IAQ61_009879 [Plenodomus lingam]|uniref:Uncharacterized protein n=1 Tax=Leptosphaeria maculans (strain JN3 / isolate v23.1.3 / race Av1-4-5-6-7-8) TaxID=985895 RepID=E4ZSN1_LEPMJ|nr:hypothetical protein LEMA_P121750.1 [Plenodomus lingam JN3]KAH9862462.1 hypothetical protein IAQ61_009879 [Plenodomus lingam]CBX94411.1 hypothetical protein LEMA_P121750.1 [Plenodomus lingam JN3]
MDEAPNCAICNAPAYPECPCEADRLQIAVKQAEMRMMEDRLAEIRDWVINHARQHILNAFERLTSNRKGMHAAYLASLPNYEIYMRYSGHPPIHPMYLSQLQAQIADANADLKRGIDADWRASVLRYPEVLDYFYSLVELRLPDSRSREVIEPPFAAAGYADRGYLMGLEKKTKKKRRDREGSVQPDVQALNRVMHVPPPVATPPIPNYQAPPPPGAYPY